MTNKNILKILFVEDLPSDAELAVLELRKEGLRFEHIRVDTRDEFIKALNEFKPDIIISDYMMPSFNGLQALKEVKELNPEIPFILCTGSINEETAVDCIKAGATDYVIKEHITRLPFAIKEALEQQRILIEKRAADLLLKENEEKLQSIFRAAPVGIGLVVDRIFIEVNDTFCKMTGYSRKELIGKKSEMVYASKEEYDNVGIEKYRQIAEKGTGSVETRFKCKDGRILNIFLSSTPLDKDDLTKGVTFTVMDITERKVEIVLHESEERFRILYNDAVVGLYRTNLHGEIFLANKTLVKMLGFQSFEELSLRNLKEKGYGPTYQRQNFIDEIEKSGEVKDLEAIWICRDGEEIFVRESARAIYDSDGKILYYDGTVQNITEQKKTAEALIKIQHLFETLARVSPVGIFRTDLNGNTTYVNPKWSELSGLSSEEALGTGWLKAVHPDDREKLTETWSINLKSRNESHAEYRFLKPDGSTVWVIGKAVSELIGNEVIGYIGTITNISERKKAEEILRSSEERLKILFDYAPDAYYLNDLKGNFIDGNIACEKLMGYNKNELIGKNLLKLKLLSLKQIPKAAKLLIKNSLGQPTGPDEFELNSQDGSKVTVEIIAHPIKIEGQTLVLGMARDISERKRAEKSLRESEEKFRSIMENSADAIFITDLKGKYVYTNKAVTAILGYSSEEMKLKTIIDILPQNKIEEYSENFKKVVIEGKVFAEIELVKKDGSIISTDLNSVLLPGGLVYGSCRDITERKLVEKTLKHAKEKAEASDKLKTIFLNNISHEVRTPLNGILGFAEIMSQIDISEEEKRVSLSMLYESSDRLLNTITNYMDISLINSGTMSLHKKDFLPDQILRELNAKNEIKCLDRHFELILEIPEQSEKLVVCSDPEILRKILTHLLNNAIKFTEKGSIKFGYTVHKAELEFFVKDTGIGIGKESLKSVFEHFVKEDRGPLKLSEGSGLGLSISKGLAELLGGKIRVESEIGIGSTFFFTVPVGKEIKFNMSGTVERKHKENRKTYSILVAEDDLINFNFLKTLLRQNTSAEIIHASNGKEAVAKFLQNPYIDLILMDIKMPVMDGLEATRQIKAINRNVPVIAITAYAMAGDESRILDAGCDHYLIKPINKKLLLEKISEYITV